MSNHLGYNLLPIIISEYGKIICMKYEMRNNCLHVHKKQLIFCFKYLMLYAWLLLKLENLLTIISLFNFIQFLLPRLLFNFKCPSVR